MDRAMNTNSRESQQADLAARETGREHHFVFAVHAQAGRVENCAVRLETS
jgi:hypothetical protein